MTHFSLKAQNYLNNILSTKKEIFNVESDFSNSKKINPNRNYLNKISFDETFYSPKVSWYHQSEILFNPSYIGYSLLMIDFDIPNPEIDYWVHWFIPFIPLNITELPQMKIYPENKYFDINGIKIKNGKNSWNKYGYGNPTPPTGSGIHRYYLFIYPVSSKISTIYFKNFIKNSDKIVCYGVTVGRYTNDYLSKKGDRSIKLLTKKSKKSKKGGMYTTFPLNSCRYQKNGYNTSGAYIVDPIYQVGNINKLPFLPENSQC